MNRLFHLISVATSISCSWLTTPAVAMDALTRLDIRHVKVGGEIGRRIDATIHNNLLVIDVDNLFLRPFREHTAGDGYIGIFKPEQRVWSCGTSARCRTSCTGW
jgi:hypothetical protein